jgi:orotidine-5'-phosphate decarboxylase
MAEIMLAPGRSDLIATKHLLEERAHKIYGVKILINDTYLFTGGNEHGRYGAVACVLAEAGARKIMLDAKTPNDVPDEMKDITNSILAGFKPKKTTNNKIRNKLIEKPNFQTAHFVATRSSLSTFMESVSRLGITPVCFTTSSRYTEQDYIDLGSNSEEFIKKSTEAVSELGFTAILCAACDAEAIKSINPDLKIFGTGGVLSENEDTDHVRSTTFRESKPFVDVYIQGSPILQASNPIESFDVRYTAMQTN